MVPNGSAVAPLASHREHSFAPMGISPNSSVGSFDEAMQHIGSGYALHGGALRGHYRHPQDTGTQTARHLSHRCSGVVPRGLEPSPVVKPARSRGGHDWAQRRPMPAGYGSVYEGADDFAHQYAGAGTTSAPRAASRVVEEPYAYCFDRGNGEYTRLIPADLLPELESVPRRQRGAEGMAVLPVPSGRAPPCSFYFKTRGTGAHTQHRPADPIQVRASRSSHIDTIVKSAPPPAPPRRNKVYCDKWVHEGTCAFTQQGCRFKHEMPLDRATQASLGLFHGLPSWWKKQQAELQRQRDQPASPSPSGRGGSESPGECGGGARLEGGRSSGGQEREGRGFGGGGRRPLSPCVFGAIGTPAQGRSGGRPRSGLAASRHNQGSRGLCEELMRHR